MIPARFVIITALMLPIVPYSGMVNAETEVRDPTRAPVRTTTDDSPVTPRTLTLQMTLVSETQRTALISGRLVDEGDSVGDARVLAIEHDSARLRDNRGEFTLELQRLPELSSLDGRRARLGP